MIFMKGLFKDFTTLGNSLPVANEPSADNALCGIVK